MNDDQLLRYGRHILLPEIGIEGQQRIMDGHVLVVGLGGLGCPASLYLAAAGVGTLTLADGDVVEASNLQRQVLHDDNTIGQPKVDSATDALARINPAVKILPLPIRLEAAELQQAVKRADVVLDCSDNFPTRHALNRACLQHRKPLISGAAIRFKGQITFFDMRNTENPCYHCLFPDGEETESLRCAVTGVFAPLTGMIGAMQAAECIKALVGQQSSLVRNLQLIDALTMTWRNIQYARDPGCRVCGSLPA